MQPQRIAIIGAGTAGLATATFLARQGHNVTLIERANELGPVGAGLLLQPAGLDVLASLGCSAHLSAYGRPIKALHGATRSGRVVMDVRYADFPAAADRSGLGVHRAALCHVLNQALAAETHTRWFGCDVASLGERGDGVAVTLEGDGDEPAGHFDAVIIANGCASRLRPEGLVRYDRRYPWGAMWLMCPIDTDLEAFDIPWLQQRYDGCHTMLGVVPTGLSPALGTEPLLSVLWSLPVERIEAWRDGSIDLDAWKARVSDLWPALDPVLRHIEAPSQLLPATYRDVIMYRWGRGRIGVIGDAAHAMSPQLGQGANMALLDARALAEAVASSACWDQVWSRFHQQRRGSIRFYQRMSRLLTPLFQSRVPGLCCLRDAGLPLGRRIPWVRRQAAKTIAGYKTRWLV